MAKPRILISYFFGPDTIPLGDSCARAFESLGFDVFRFNSQMTSPINEYGLRLLRKLCFNKINFAKHTRWDNERFRYDQLEKAVAAFRPDILFVIRGNSYPEHLIARLKSTYNIKHTVGWWVKDPREDASEIIHDSAIYDHYFSIHRSGLDAHPHIQSLLAIGLDPSLYFPLDSEFHKSPQHDVVFVGGHSKRREAILKELSAFDVKIYGPGWRKLKTGIRSGLWRNVVKRGIWGEELNALYNNSRIVLNITSWETEKTGGLNLRVVDVPATGALLITDWSQDLQALFPHATPETFKSVEELKEKISTYLSDETLRAKRARDVYSAALEIDTYEKKMQFVLDTIGFKEPSTEPDSTNISIS